jgi:uncharacterized protein
MSFEVFFAMKRFAIAAALVVSLASPALADVKAGVEAWSKGDYNAAIKEWRPLAIKGDADAQFNLGQAYKMGRGVPPDLKAAEQWYAKAAAQGHWQAEDNLGLVMFQNGDRERAMPWLEKSATRGEPRAQYILGIALFNGDVVGKNWPRAYALITRASASGMPSASRALAQMDQQIPIEQRQQGLAMARDMELASARPQFDGTAAAPAASFPPPPPARVAETPPIRTEELPASTAPGATYDVRPVAPPPPVRTAPRPAPVRVAPAPVESAPVARLAAGKGWRIQLGAFGDQARARALWQSVEGRVGSLTALTPYLVQAGAVTRLQGGNLASRASAERVCGEVRAAGNSCLVVAP